MWDVRYQNVGRMWVMRFEMWDIAPHCGTFEGMLRGRRATGKILYGLCLVMSRIFEGGNR